MRENDLESYKPDQIEIERESLMNLRDRSRRSETPMYRLLGHAIEFAMTHEESFRSYQRAQEIRREAFFSLSSDVRDKTTEMTWNQSFGGFQIMIDNQSYALVETEEDWEIRETE